MPAGSGHLNMGESLFPGQSIGGSAVKLVFQQDGNLVLYGSRDQVCWASNTDGRGGVRATYQDDGNFVIDDGGNHPLWASNTVDQGGNTVNINLWGQVWVGETAITPYCP